MQLGPQNLGKNNKMILTEYDLVTLNLQSPYSGKAERSESPFRRQNQHQLEFFSIFWKLSIETEGRKINNTLLSFRMEKRSHGFCVNFPLNFISEKL